MADPQRFGGVLRHREAAADVWGWRWLDEVGQDARFAWRTLRLGLCTSNNLKNALPGAAAGDERPGRSPGHHLA